MCFKVGGLLILDSRTVQTNLNVIPPISMKNDKILPESSAGDIIFRVRNAKTYPTTASSTPRKICIYYRKLFAEAEFMAQIN